jgi:multimeric flavodoxin WrbA
MCEGNRQIGVKNLLKILVLLGSSRKNGNTEYMSNRALHGVNHTAIHLADYNLQPIIDMRHTEEGFSPVEDDYEKLLQHIIHHDIIIFATPLYWYGMSGHMKNFVDRWSQYLRDERFDLKENLNKKKAYVIVAGGNSAPITALPLIQQFHYIFNYVGMEFVDYVIACGVKPEEVSYDKLAVEKVCYWNSEFKS